MTPNLAESTHCHELTRNICHLMGNDLPLTKSKYRYLVFTSTD